MQTAETHDICNVRVGKIGVHSEIICLTLFMDALDPPSDRLVIHKKGAIRGLRRNKPP